MPAVAEAGTYVGMLPELEMKTLMDLEMALLVGSALQAQHYFPWFVLHCASRAPVHSSLLPHDVPVHVVLPSSIRTVESVFLPAGRFGLSAHGLAPIHRPCCIYSECSDHRHCAGVLVRGSRRVCKVTLHTDLHHCFKMFLAISSDDSADLWGMQPCRSILNDSYNTDVLLKFPPHIVALGCLTVVRFLDAAAAAWALQEPSICSANTQASWHSGGGDAAARCPAVVGGIGS
jgi:hypothetical protein